LRLYLGVCVRTGTGSVSLSKKGAPRKPKPLGGGVPPGARGGPKGLKPGPLGGEEVGDDVAPRGLKGLAYMTLLLAAAIAEYCESAEDVCRAATHPESNKRQHPPPGVWCPGAPGCPRRTP
jgi:hypothetical protein